MDTVRWKLSGNTLRPGKVRLIDQTRLPEECVYIETDDIEDIYNAIRRLSVRGAPAIGCAAALGLAAAGQHSTAENVEQFLSEVRDKGGYLKSARPTAVNLAWAVDRCVASLEAEVREQSLSVEEVKDRLVQEAKEIVDEDMNLCYSIGEAGVQLFEGQKNLGVLTHCNAGALAASDYGTALSPVYRAQEQGLAPRVYADETRPLLQGARLTAWELEEAGIDVTVICDNMAAQVMREGLVNMVIVGTDRIAANGDVANKIGTYGLAILADYHRVPFYVATPYSTIDMDTPRGQDIPIEQRDPEEIRSGAGRTIVPQQAKVYNPAFDVTPRELVSGVITERGVLKPSFDTTIDQWQTA